MCDPLLESELTGVGVGMAADGLDSSGSVSGINPPKPGNALSDFLTTSLLYVSFTPAAHLETALKPSVTLSQVLNNPGMTEKGDGSSPACGSKSS